MDISTRMLLKNFELRLFRTEMIISTARPTRVCSSSFPVSVSGITRVSVPPLSRRLHSRSISSAQAVTFPCLDHLLQLFKLPFLLLLSTAHLLSTSPYRALSETYACSSLICLKTPNSQGSESYFHGIARLSFYFLVFSCLSRFMSFYSTYLSSPSKTSILESFRLLKCTPFLPHLWPSPNAPGSTHDTELLNFSSPFLTPCNFLSTSVQMSCPPTCTS